MGLSNGRATNAILDEVQLSQTNLSANWITAEYNNQSSPGNFVSFGTEGTFGGGGGGGGILRRPKNGDAMITEYDASDPHFGSQVAVRFAGLLVSGSLGSAARTSRLLV
jgi:hypothetical protein